MLELLKKFFNSTQVIKSELKNQELIEKIYNIVYIENLDKILFSPVGKLYILNVYNNTFDDFLSNILSKNNRELAAVNINSYFTDKENIQYKLKRIITILEKNDINVKVEYELNEIIEAVHFLKYLEEKENGK